MSVFRYIICDKNRKHSKLRDPNAPIDIKKAPPPPNICKTCGSTMHYADKWTGTGWVLVNGKAREREETCDTKTEAQKAETKLKNDRIDKKERQPKTKMTFGQAAEEYFEALEGKVKKIKMSQNSLDTYKSRYNVQLKRRFELMRLSKMTTKILQDFMKEREGEQTFIPFMKGGKVSLKYSGKLTALSTIDYDMMVMSNILGYCEIKNYIQKNPAKGVERFNPDNERTIFMESREQVLAFLKECKGMVRRAVIVSLFTGLRNENCVSLNRVNIDIIGNLIIHLGKGNKKLFIPMFPQLRILLLEWMREGATPINGDLLPSSRKPMSHISTDAAWYGVKQACKKVLVKHPEWAHVFEDMTFHDLRHTFATQYLYWSAKTNKSDTDLSFAKFNLSRLLGHSDEVITKRYLHVISRIFSAGADAFESYFDDDFVIPEENTETRKKGVNE